MIKRTYNPFEPRNKFDALLRLQTSLERQEPVSSDLARWLMTGLKTYLNTDGCSLDRVLGLVARQGGSNETPKKLELARRRDSLIRALADLAGGNITHQGEVVADWINGHCVADNPEAKSLLKTLLDEFPNCPKSSRQIHRVLNKDRVHFRRL